MTIVDVAFISIIVGVTASILTKTFLDFKRDVEKHFKSINDEQTITFDEDKAKNIKLKTRK